MYPDFYSPAEVAQLLGITLSAIERMRERGAGPPYYRVSGGTIRGRIGYRKRDVEEWLSKRRGDNHEPSPTREAPHQREPIATKSAFLLQVRQYAN